MDSSLSVLLPVHNAQYQLEDAVARILDVLPDLTHYFDLVIIDDGSTDDTTDIARDLTLRYPQVGMVRHPWRLGLAAIQTGLDNSDGAVVFVGDESHGIDPADLRHLWRMRHEREVVVAQPTESKGPRSGWLKKFMDWRAVDGAHEAAEARLQMVRRDALARLRQPGGPLADSTRRVDGQSTMSDPKSLSRPNYLDRVKRFALDE